MNIRIAGLLATAAALCTACTPTPGSAEWCKGVIQGTIKPSEQEVTANDEKCSQEMMKEVIGKLPGG
jgi:hypothetical protein